MRNATKRRRPFSHRRPASLLLLALLTAGTACEAPTGPRELTSPRLEAAAPFRATTDRAADDTTEGGVGGSFEDRLRQRGATRRDDEDTGTLALQRVRLAEGLTGELPREGWSWARNGDVSLLLHGTPPDALVYAESFSDLARQRPAAALNRFYLGVDPPMASTWLGIGSDLAPMAALAAAKLPMSTPQVQHGLEMLLTPTLGRGLGFRPDAGAFAGWRWLGQNAAGTYLRLARNPGVWQAQDPLPEDVERLLELLADGAPELADLLWQDPSPNVDSRRAWMIFGSASRDDGAGAHLAILCRLRPECAAAQDLARFVDSLAPPQSAARALSASGASIGFNDISRQAGLTLYAGNQALNQASLQQAVQATLALLPSADQTTEGTDATSTDDAAGEATPNDQQSTADATDPGTSDNPSTAVPGPDSEPEETNP